MAGAHVAPAKAVNFPWGIPQLHEPKLVEMLARRAASGLIAATTDAAARRRGSASSVSASPAAPMAVRWATTDRLHHCTGVVKPAWDDSKLPERLEAFEATVEAHHRY